MRFRTRPQTVAVVEDDEAVSNSLDFLLFSAGYQTRVCADIAQASAAGVDRADCLIVDCALPDGNGLALIQQLREQGYTGPALLIASLPSPQCRDAARRAGIPLLEKPLDSDSLLSWLSSVLVATDPE